MKVRELVLVSVRVCVRRTVGHGTSGPAPPGGRHSEDDDDDDDVGIETDVGIWLSTYVIAGEGVAGAAVDKRLARTLSRS